MNRTPHLRRRMPKLERAAAWRADCAWQRIHRWRRSWSARASLDRLAAVADPASAHYIREAAAVQRLLSPAEMGELFKVIVLTQKSGGIVWPYLQAADRSHRL